MSTQIRILTYNVSWEGQTGKLSNTTDGRLCVPNGVNVCTSNVISLIAGSNADIVLLQEASIDVSRLPSEYKYVQHVSGIETMITAYKPAVVGNVQSAIPGEFEPGRPFLITVFPRLIVVNVHRPHTQNALKDTTILENALASKSALLHSRSVILGGDFNMELPVNPTFFNKELDVGLHVQRRKTCCSASFGIRDKTYKYLYDYIAIDERLRFDELYVPISADKNVQFSDHRPVFAVVSLRGLKEQNPTTNLIDYILTKGTRLYRGVNVLCANLQSSVRPGRAEWFAQFKSTSMIYSRRGCLFRLETTRPLRMIDIWNAESMRTIVDTYTNAYRNKTITRDELDAFIVFSGYGIDKHPTLENPTPIQTLAKQHNWLGMVDPMRPTTVTVTQENFPLIQRLSAETIQVRGLPWGPGDKEFNRTSTFEGDAIVMRTLQRLFPMYDGVYASPVPSTYHHGMFAEEFILFPDVLEKVREVSRSVGGRRLTNVVATYRTPYAHRKPLRKTRRMVHMPT